MGIQGLLHFVHEASTSVRLTQFSGQTAAVDGFVWMHRAVLKCAREVALGLPTRAFISSFLKRVQQLIDVGIIPFIVFDGAELPAKACTNSKRRTSRSTALKMARELESRGMKAESQDQYKLAVEITPSLLHPLFETLRKRNIRFLVAPFEADAEIAYLVKNGFADFAITEDSDLIVYGCPRTLFKLTSNGDGELITLDRVFNISSLVGFSHPMLRDACVLSGCDYLPSIKGLGLKTAIKRVSEAGDGIKALQKLREMGWDVPETYENEFKIATSVFLSQIIYNPVKKEALGIEIMPTIKEAGEFWSKSIIIGVAEGYINSKTLEPFQDSYVSEDDLVFSSTTNSQNSPYFPKVVIERSASKPFKPHFGNPVQPIRPKKAIPQSQFVPDKSKRITLPFFTPPSLRSISH